jgi:DUF2905 family protein
VSGLGRFLILAGIILIAAGILIIVAPRLPWLGKLPGDIHIRRENFSFYFPLATCLLISALISMILWLFRR